MNQFTIAGLIISLIVVAHVFYSMWYKPAYYRATPATNSKASRGITGKQRRK